MSIPEGSLEARRVMDQHDLALLSELVTKCMANGVGVHLWPPCDDKVEHEQDHYESMDQWYISLTVYMGVRDIPKHIDFHGDHFVEVARPALERLNEELALAKG